MRADDRRHSFGDHQRWRERFSFEFAGDAGVGSSLRMELRPAEQRAWFWVHVVEVGCGLISVCDFDLALPRGTSLSVRGDGLWSDLICETPFEHWSMGLEAFGVRLDDPADAFRGEFGERVAVGFDLEWEATSPPVSHSLEGEDISEQPGVVFGEILLGADSIDFSGRGHRSHSWGVEPVLAAGAHRASVQIGDDVAVVIEQRGGETWGWFWSGGEQRALLDVDVATDVGADGLAVSARYVLDGDYVMNASVVGLAPVLIPGVPERRVVRALCRYETPHGVGNGWAEWWPSAAVVTVMGRD